MKPISIGPYDPTASTSSAFQHHQYQYQHQQQPPSTSALSRHVPGPPPQPAKKFQFDPNLVSTGGHNNSGYGNGNANAGSYSAFIKPGTGAFGSSLRTGNMSSPFRQAQSGVPSRGGFGHSGGSFGTGQNAHLTSAPARMVPAKNEDGEELEVFDVAHIPLSSGDFEQDPHAQEHMRELLSGAIGSGEDEVFLDGEDVIQGFKPGFRLLPHQVRGVKWMREREKGKKRGGILADDMGLGKTVQAIAIVVERTRGTAAEKKQGYTGGTL